MTTPSSLTATADREQRVLELMASCERALAEGRGSEADRALLEAETLLPEHPRVLHEQARRLMAAGDARAARASLERAVAQAPREIRLLHSLAAAERTLALNEHELATLERILAIEPRDTLALLLKGAVLDRVGKRRTASRIYGNAIQTIAPGARFPKTLEPLVREAQRRVSEGMAELGAFMDRNLQVPDLASAGSRAVRSVDLMLGRARAYVPRPTSLYFPHLSNYEYYPRSLFPWLGSLEAATAAIRAECIAAMREDSGQLEPYIAYREGVPLDQWRELNHSRRWSAYFLWKEGAALASHIDRCPRTAEALAVAPRVDILGHGPTAFFSILDANTKIPPHHGVTNARLTVHLPLVVPSGCRFRVGNETRHWREGEAWVFDDTIEHEAWNDSVEPRAILIFDVWHPELTAAERDYVRHAIVAMAAYFDAEGAQDFGL